MTHIYVEQLLAAEANDVDPDVLSAVADLSFQNAEMIEGGETPNISELPVYKVSFRELLLIVKARDEAAYKWLAQKWQGAHEQVEKRGDAHFLIPESLCIEIKLLN